MSHQELQERAKRRYVRGVFGIRQVARELGVPPTTVRRWVNPEYAERSRTFARNYKETRRRPCPRCGRLMSSDAAQKKGQLAQRCHVCFEQDGRDSRVWTREAVIDAIQKWASEHGVPPVSSDWDQAGDYYPNKISVYQNKASKNSPFRYWADAVEAAGYKRPKVGHKRSRTA